MIHTNDSMQILWIFIHKFIFYIENIKFRWIYIITLRMPMHPSSLPRPSLLLLLSNPPPPNCICLNYIQILMSYNSSFIAYPISDDQKKLLIFFIMPKTPLIKNKLKLGQYNCGWIKWDVMEHVSMTIWLENTTTCTKKSITCKVDCREPTF